VISSNEADHDISELVFDDLEGFRRHKADTSLKGGLCALRRLKWSDGAKITSDDVIFTFDTITSEARSPFARVLTERELSGERA
jgi:hypothetical protein